MPKPIDPATVRMIVSLYIQNDKVRNIAGLCGVSSGTVTNVARRAKLPLRRRSSRRPILGMQTLAEMKARQFGLSAEQSQMFCVGFRVGYHKAMQRVRGWRRSERKGGA